MPLMGTFKENVNRLNQIFENCADITKLDVKMETGDKTDGRIYFVNEAVSSVTIRKVISGLTDVEEIDTIESACKAVLSGNAVLLLDLLEKTEKSEKTEESEKPEKPKETGAGKEQCKQCKALKIRGTGYPEISISEAKDEQVMRGSNEGFNISYKTNEVLVRKRIRSADLKIEEKQLGVRTDTGIAILYMEGIVRKEVLNEVKKRLDTFTIDGFMDSGVIEQLTDGTQWSPFPQYMTTTRPDRTAQFLLDGHVAILTDHSPVALILPVNIGVFMKTADDYYERWGIVTFERIIRYIALFFSVSLPALYISVINFHPEILPDNLVHAFIEARRNIPYPVFVEVLVMEIAFELIREAGIRVPGAMGNAIGVVGGLIVGSAAVEASLASPIIVIIVALTAMCSFAIPNTEFSTALRIVKYFLILLSQIYGIFGYISGILLVMLHLSGVESYGFPYLGPIAASEINDDEDRKDFIVRMPYRFLKKRPIFAAAHNKTKLKLKK